MTLLTTNEIAGPQDNQRYNEFESKRTLATVTVIFFVKNTRRVPVRVVCSDSNIKFYINSDTLQRDRLQNTTNSAVSLVDYTVISILIGPST